MSLPAYALNQLAFPQMYERHLVRPLFRPWALALLDEAGLREGDRVIDIACGTGIVARLARERLGSRGQVVGVDVSAPMLEVARELSPSIDWREGNAAALPLREGEQFDVVACQQGLQFFGERERAAREMRRALARGGRLAITTWRPIAEAPVFRETYAIAERLLGSVVDQRFALGVEDELVRLLRDAGLGEVRSRKVVKTVRFEEPAALARLNAMALVGMSGAARRLDDAGRDSLVGQIAERSLEVMRTYAEGDAIAFDTAANMVTATA